MNGHNEVDLAASSWLTDFLARKGLQAPDRRMLYAYDLSIDELRALEALLTARLKHSEFGSLVASGSVFSALFVLYAADWWKREYNGGVWDWSPIVERLVGEDADVPQQIRTECVTKGLRFWGHRPLTEGKRFLGAIVAQGGIPMRLLAHGAGPVSIVLHQVTKLADRYRWNRAQILEAIQDRKSMLQATYRRPEISDLLCDFALTALELKSEYRLSEVADPVAHLDQYAPQWQRRFPISMESDAAQGLLAGLVREVSAHRPAGGSELFRCERRLIEMGGAGVYEIESLLNHVGRVDGDPLATLFGLAGAEQLPRYFSIELETDARQPYLEGRVILGAASPVVGLTGRRVSQRGNAALLEHRLVMRSPTDSVATCPTVVGGGELALDDPWIFVEGEDGIVRHVGSGSVRLPGPSALIAIGDGWVAEPHEDTARPVEAGRLIVGNSQRIVLRADRDVMLTHAGVRYRVRLNQTSETNELYQWSGARLAEANGKLVFRDRNPPELHRVGAEGVLQRVPLVHQVWRVAGSGSAINPRDARGPIDVSILHDGETVARQRIVVLPPRARIEYRSGERVGIGSVALRGWGDVDVSVAALPQVSGIVTHDPQGAVIRVDLDAAGAPPPDVKLYVRWRGCPRELVLIVPFPVTGGRFIRGDGSLIGDGDRLLLRELVGTRLQIFDTNPDNPKAYALVMTLGVGLRQFVSEYSVRLDDSGRADVRLIDYRKPIESLLGMTDALDAAVSIVLKVGSALTSRVVVAHYAATLERQGDTVALPTERVANATADVLERAKVLAHPLASQLDHGPIKLMQTTSEGVPTGVWAAAELVREKDPWLVFPSEDSSIYFRPMIWTAGQVEGALTPTVREDLCPLAQATVMPSPAERWDVMNQVIDAMAVDYWHPSWPLVGGIWETFHHLPLSSLDLWRAMAKKPKAVLALLLRVPLDDRSIGESATRLHNEVGWSPELTALEDWHSAVSALWAFHRATIPAEIAAIVKPADVMRDDLKRRLAVLSSVLPSLELTLDLVLFELTNRASESLNEVWIAAEARSNARLRRLWQGADSLGNSHLFLVNANRDHWPAATVLRKGLRALPVLFRAGRHLADSPHIRSCSGRRSNDFKVSVANMPMLCALWAMTSTSRRWWAARSTGWRCAGFTISIRLVRSGLSRLGRRAAAITV